MNIVNYYTYWSICQCSQSSDWNINRAPLQCEAGGSANNRSTIFWNASANIKDLSTRGRSADVFNTAALCWSVFAAVLYLSKITYPRVDTLRKTRRFGKGSKCNKYRAIPFITFSEILGHKQDGVKYIQFLLSKHTGPTLQPQKSPWQPLQYLNPASPTQEAQGFNCTTSTLISNWLIPILWQIPSTKRTSFNW
jgi:hypothetical protein